MQCHALVIPHMLIPPKSIDISSELWIGLYNCLTYTYLCVPEALWCQHFLNWTHYLPFLQTSNSSYISISVNVRARPSGHPYLLTTSSSLLPAYRHLHSHKFLHSWGDISLISAPINLPGHCLSSHFVISHLDYFSFPDIRLALLRSMFSNCYPEWFFKCKSENAIPFNVLAFQCLMGKN